MKIAKRIFLFILTNILIVTTLSIVLQLVGVRPYITPYGLDYTSLAIFCLIWGFGGAFISLALSRVMAKWFMGVRVIDPQTTQPQERDLVARVHRLCQLAGLQTMPEIGIYESDEINAFATGPSKNRSLVAVSTGLLNRFNNQEIDGVLGHEIAHITNGDMVTMTLLQGVVNAFVMFFARVIAFAVSQAVKEEQRRWVQFGVTILAEILLGILGMILVARFSRYREYRADAGGADLSGRGNMIAALKAIQRTMNQNPLDNRVPSLASFKISGKQGKFLSLFSTHPALEDRIQKLQQPL